jgi:hypothetical protein
MSKASKDGECFMALVKGPKWIWKEKLENFATDQYVFRKIKNLYTK